MAQQFQHLCFSFLFQHLLLLFLALSSSRSSVFPSVLSSALVFKRDAEFVIGSASQLTVGGLLLTGGLR